MAKAKFKVLVTSYIDDRIREPGTIVEYDVRAAGSNLERVTDGTGPVPAAVPAEPTADTVEEKSEGDEA